jgi:glycosyltransferase involved in cell wall biosynthesis
MAKISVAICCANVADTLEAACQSVAWADELVVVDSGSTDATAQIAQRYAGRYLVEPWRGYTGQKKFAAGLCRNPWVLVLDGDEEVAPALAREISALTDTRLAGLDLLSMRRRNWMMGRVVRSWGPDWQSRLIHTERVTWAAEALHDNRLPSHPARAGRLRGFLEHRRTARRGFREYFDGSFADARLALTASELYARGRRCRWWDLLLRPSGAFAKHYLLKGGFRDGLFGLMIAQKAATAVQLKYAALWARQNGFLEESAPAAARPAAQPKPDAR